MNYELAKELKEAGFPQHGTSTAYSACEEDKCFSDACIFDLSELIEACEGQVFMLLINRNLEGRWAAALDGQGASGDTPTEAVARLWLTLNKK